MFSEAALTKANIIAFLKEKGLYDECGEWCQPRYVQQEQEKAAKKDAEPVWKRIFRWEGHHTRCCYESSGTGFDDSTNWIYFVGNMELLPFTFIDPSAGVHLHAGDTHDDRLLKLKDCKNFDKLCARMLDFVNGALDDDVDRCHDFDKFGFDNPPSESALIEWLGNLEADPDDVDPDDCFCGPSY